MGKRFDKNVTFMLILTIGNEITNTEMNHLEVSQLESRNLQCQLHFDRNLSRDHVQATVDVLHRLL